MARIKSLSLSMLIRVLDVGCGDMTLARGLLDQVEGIDLACFDIPPLRSVMKTNEDFDPIWQRYQQFDGSSLPFDEHAFDVVIFSDVLHHVPAGLVSPLLKSAARVGIQVAVCRNLLLGFTQLMVLLPRPFISLLFLVLVFSFFADRHR